MTIDKAPKVKSEKLSLRCPYFLVIENYPEQSSFIIL